MQDPSHIAHRTSFPLGSVPMICVMLRPYRPSSAAIFDRVSRLKVKPGTRVTGTDGYGVQGFGGQEGGKRFQEFVVAWQFWVNR